MPVYEYKCQSCGVTSEILVHVQGSVQDLLCPSCGSRKLEKLFSVPGLVKNRAAGSGGTYCGREQRCDTPPCSGGGGCCH